MVVYFGMTKSFHDETFGFSSETNSETDLHFAKHALRTGWSRRIQRHYLSFFFSSSVSSFVSPFGIHVTRQISIRMTHLAGGWASVPVDAKKRLVDGDASGDLYSGIEHALGGKLPSPVTILSAERQVCGCVCGVGRRLPDSLIDHS